jgi:NAD(P)-dependent dehydrogenase (short-subunit alcohol dehydrogenase family)
MKPEVAVVTGAAAGVGRATARAFGKRGAWVGLLARGDGLEEARQEIEQAGGRALAIHADVADEDQVEAAAERIEAELGPVDIWVNNAMTTVFSPFWQITRAEYRRATDVTYLGFVWGTMSALKRVLPRNRGTIVQVGSALACRAIPLQSPYCGAKHAIRGFTDSIRTELLHDGKNIHITMVQLPAMNTPQFSWCRTRLPRHPQPVPPIFQPEVAAEAIVWAAHHRRRELFVGLPTFKAILGNKLFPKYADRYPARTGFDSQQTDEPVSPDRPSNLFEPVPGDFGAHGEFGNRAIDWSPITWLSMNRGLVFAGAALGLGFVASRWLVPEDARHAQSRMLSSNLAQVIAEGLRRERRLPREQKNADSWLHCHRNTLILAGVVAGAGLSLTRLYSANTSQSHQLGAAHGG